MIKHVGTLKNAKKKLSKSAAKIQNLSTEMSENVYDTSKVKYVKNKKENKTKKLFLVGFHFGIDCRNQNMKEFYL